MTNSSLTSFQDLQSCILNRVFEANQFQFGEFQTSGKIDQWDSQLEFFDTIWFTDRDLTFQFGEAIVDVVQRFLFCEIAAIWNQPFTSQGIVQCDNMVGSNISDICRDQAERTEQLPIISRSRVQKAFDIVGGSVQASCQIFIKAAWAQY